MNAPEKKVFILALFLFALGILVKVSPWDPVPQIETFSYAEQPREALKNEHNPNGFVQIELSGLKESAKTGNISRNSKKTKPAVHFPIAINRATAEELCAIQGVGPKLAEKMIAYRSSHGRFSGPSDLKKVSGIGKKKAEKILTFIIFD